MSQSYFLSDIHIRDPEESNSKKLLLFLHQLIEGESSEKTNLFLVGDIFDLWIYDHRYFVEKYQKIVNAIREVVIKGVQVHYFEGNHDLYLKSFWQQDVGVEVHDGPMFFQLHNKTFRIEHGDLMNPDDKGYLFLKSFLQTLPMKVLAKNLPGPAVQWIGHRASLASRNYTSQEKKMDTDKILSFMHNYPTKVALEKDFDIFIAGHTHLSNIYEFDIQGKTHTAINLGSWFQEQKILCFNDEGYKFITL